MRIYSRRLKTGTYWYIDYVNQNGKRVRRAVGRRKKDAELILSRIRLKVFEGKYDEIPQPQKFASAFKFMDRYVEYRESQSPGFFKKEAGRFKTMTRFFEENKIIYLNQITPGMVQKLQTDYMKDHSRKSWNLLLGGMKSMLNKAVEWQIIENNPIKYIKKLKLDQTFNYFSKEEIDSVIGAAREPLKTAIIILANTGMRRSELYNLIWKDVDFNNRRIIIRKSKSRKIRAIPMTDTVYNFLKEKKRSGDHVCRPFKPDWYSRAFKSVLKKLRINGKLHDLRHTFASHLVINGVQLQVVQELLGHRSITTTQIYAHLSPEVHAESIKKLGF